MKIKKQELKKIVIEEFLKIQKLLNEKRNVEKLLKEYFHDDIEDLDGVDEEHLIKNAIHDANQVFWNAIAKHFPETTTGDFSPHDTAEFEEAQIKAVKNWLASNQTIDSDRNDDESGLDEMLGVGVSDTVRRGAGNRMSPRNRRKYQISETLQLRKHIHNQILEAYNTEDSLKKK